MGVQCVWVSNDCLYIFINFPAPFFPFPGFEQQGPPPKDVTAEGFELEKAKIYDESLQSLENETSVGAFDFGKFLKLDTFFISNPAATLNLTALGCSENQSLLSENQD